MTTSPLAPQNQRSGSVDVLSRASIARCQRSAIARGNQVMRRKLLDRRVAPSTIVVGDLSALG
jgi:hypothetical protein